MRVSTLLVTAAASLLSITPTTARITGFYAPATVVPGATLPILIRAENYIQPVQDVAVAFGITPAEEHYPGTLGTFMGEESIGPGKSSQVRSKLNPTSCNGLSLKNTPFSSTSKLQHRRQHHSQHLRAHQPARRQRDYHGGSVRVVRQEFER